MEDDSIKANVSITEQVVDYVNTLVADKPHWEQLAVGLAIADTLIVQSIIGLSKDQTAAWAMYQRMGENINRQLTTHYQQRDEATLQ